MGAPGSGRPFAVNQVSGLGGGYAESPPDPGPTVDAVLAAARPGSAAARLIVVAGPPGVGKSAVASRLADLTANSVHLDKDWAAGGFILEAARADGRGCAAAYSGDRYWQCLRPLEYAGAVTAACANLVGTRSVFLVGGWGPELSVDRLWEELRRGLAPAGLQLLHLDAPPLETWRERMAARGSRSDSPWFEHFARAVTSQQVWCGAHRIPTSGPLPQVVQLALDALDAF